VWDVQVQCLDSCPSRSGQDPCSSWEQGLARVHIKVPSDLRNLGNSRGGRTLVVRRKQPLVPLGQNLRESGLCDTQRSHREEDYSIHSEGLIKITMP
jgi:hypothetical protein